jgi:hypothetical protein
MKCSTRAVLSLPTYDAKNFAQHLGWPAEAKGHKRKIFIFCPHNTEI